MTSGGYGWAVGRSIAYAYLPPEAAAIGTRGHVEVFGEWVGCEVAREPLWDPEGRGSGREPEGSEGRRGRRHPAGDARPTGGRDPAGDAASGPAWSAAHRRAPQPDLARWLSLALELADEADRVAMHHFRRDLEIQAKPDRSFVTQADQQIERLIRERIRAVHPDHGLVGEEYGTDEGRTPIRWYIDPIDGTHNFMRGVPLFGTLLAVEVEARSRSASCRRPRSESAGTRPAATAPGPSAGTGRAGAIRVSSVSRDGGRPAHLRQPPRRHRVRTDARLRRRDRRLLARPGVRGLLGLCPGRRRRGGGDDRGGHARRGTWPRRSSSSRRPAGASPTCAASAGSTLRRSSGRTPCSTTISCGCWSARHLTGSAQPAGS